MDSNNCSQVWDLVISPSIPSQFYSSLLCTWPLTRPRDPQQEDDKGITPFFRKQIYLDFFPVIIYALTQTSFSLPRVIDFKGLFGAQMTLYTPVSCSGASVETNDGPAIIMSCQEISLAWSIQTTFIQRGETNQSNQLFDKVSKTLQLFGWNKIFLWVRVVLFRNVPSLKDSIKYTYT